MTDTDRSHAEYFYCRGCLHGCYGRQSYRNHLHLCSQNDPCRIKMPTEDASFMRFTKMTARAKVPFCIYADLEATTPKVQECQPESSKAFTTIVEQHIPCGASAILVNAEMKIVDQFFCRREDCIDRMMAKFREWAEYVYEQKHKYPVYEKKPGDIKLPRNAKQCWLCEKPFSNAKDKVFEHDHVTGKLRGIGHQTCNSACKSPCFLPVFFHNGAGYDFKHVLKQYRPEKDYERVKCIPSSEETYISFSVSVPVASKTDKKTDKAASGYAILKFVDSFKFLSKTLERLVGTMKKDQIPLKILRAGFPHFTEEQIELISRKGVYPYSYMDSFDRFEERKFPERWTDSISRELVSKDDYEHGKVIWSKFGVENLGDYHDLYLQTDVHLLADVFEYFRKLCMEKYGLDPAHYLTALNLCWDAMLKTTGVMLKLILDKDQLDFVRASIRGGMCGTYHKRHWKANNPKCCDYDPAKPTNWMLLLDANNLYGGVMMEPLPSGDFEWVEKDVKLEDILATADNASQGYFVMVDLEYPTTLHDEHQDFPLAPEHMKITRTRLSEFSEADVEKQYYALEEETSANIA